MLGGGDIMSTVRVFSTMGDIMSTLGDIMIHVGEIMRHVGDIMSTMGGYHEYLPRGYDSFEVEKFESYSFNKPFHDRYSYFDI